MKELFTPKQVARAIQVSESSVKRWCDKGDIPTQYTGGGHRRIPLGGLLAFLRTNRHALVRPEVLGLPAISGQTDRVIERAEEQFLAALLTGDEQQCRRIVLDLYLAEHRLSVICDRVFTKAFETVGDRWACQEAEVYQERRGCEIVLRLLRELRGLTVPPPQGAWRAIGGAAEGDQYSLPTSMAELVLRDGQWDAVSLGNNLPFDTLAAALERQRPRLFWLSVSHLRDEAEFLDGYNRLYERFGLQVAFVVGGRALQDALRQQMNYAAHCDNMQHLASFAQTLRSSSTSSSQ